MNALLFAQAGSFLIRLLLDTYIYTLIARLLCQKLSVPYYNPISQLTTNVTQAFVKPLQRVLSEYRGFDFSIIILILFFELIEVILLLGLQLKTMPRSLAGLLVFTIGELGEKVVNFYFFSVVLEVISSWIVSLQRSPVVEIIHLIVEPIMLQARRIIPSISGLDLSPIAVLALLQFSSILFFKPIMMVGLHFLTIH